ncbi:MAG: hypothetical protein ACYTEQ_17740 [Planctomycetota bacterium]|jgi:hypothetical protein
MRHVGLILLLVLAGLLLAACELQIDPETEYPRPEPDELLVIYELGEMETCMFTLWAFTQPENRPTPEGALEWCRKIIINMGEAEYSGIMEFIREAIDGIDKIDCSKGNCL